MDSSGTRMIVAGLLIVAGGVAQAGEREPPGCEGTPRERVEWRWHGNPAKPVAIGRRVREAHAACADVAERERPRDEDLERSGG